MSEALKQSAVKDNFNDQKENEISKCKKSLLKKDLPKRHVRKFGKDISNISNILSVNELFPSEKVQKKNSNTKKRRQHIDKKTKNVEVNISVLKSTVIHEDPQQCYDYIDDIYEYFKECDGMNLPLDGYMTLVQNDISERMRSILLDWLIEVHLKFKLLPETLHLTINIIDRYLSKKAINRKYLQLLGVAAMFIACKYEEIYPPEMENFIYMTDNAYNKEQMLKMEYDILTVLDFNITQPSPLRFLEILKLNLKLDEETLFICQYILELCITDYSMIKFSPGMLSTCVVYVVEKMNKVENEMIWTMSGLNKENENVRECIKKICVVITNIENMQFIAVKKKYSLESYKGVAKSFNSTKYLL